MKNACASKKCPYLRYNSLQRQIRMPLTFAFPEKRETGFEIPHQPRITASRQLVIADCPVSAAGLRFELDFCMPVL